MIYNKNNLNVAKCAYKKEFNPILTGVYFDKNKTVATDSFILCEMSVLKNRTIADFPDVPGLDKNVKHSSFVAGAKEIEKIKLPSGKRVKDLPILKTAVVKAMNAETVDFLTTDLENTEVKSIRLIEGDFPAYEQLWPIGEPKAQIVLNAKLLKTLLDVLGELDEKDNRITFKIFGENSPMVLEAKNLDQEGRAMIMPIIPND